MATMEMDAGTVERAFELLQGALASKNSREALKICEDFEMEVSFPPCFPTVCRQCWVHQPDAWL